MFRVWVVYTNHVGNKNVWCKFYDVRKLMEARLLGLNDFMKEVRVDRFTVTSVEVDEIDEDRCKQFKEIN